jgi:hypothetical membrane protein
VHQPREISKVVSHEREATPLWCLHHLAVVDHTRADVPGHTLAAALRCGEAGAMTHTISSTAQAAPRTTRPSAASIAGISGFLGFTAASLLAGAVTPGYSMVSQDISGLAALDAPHPRIMMTGFVLLATGTVVTAIALRRQLTSRAATAVAVLVGLAGACLYGSAFARLDCSTERAACQALEQAGAVSGHHVVHDLVSLLSFLLAIAALLILPRAIRANGGGQQLARTSRIIGIAGVALLVSMLTGVTGAVEGLAQRLFIVLVYGWPVLITATRPPRINSSSVEETSLTAQE